MSRTLPSMHLTSLILPLALWGATSTIAAQHTVERARELRRESVEALGNKDFRTASERLQAAIAIYDRLDDDHTEDRATCYRAIVFNEVDDGQTDAALEWFQRLAELAQTNPAAYGQLEQAFGAVVQAAQNATSPDLATQSYSRARQTLEQSKHAALAAQCVHNLAGAAAESRAAEFDKLARRAVDTMRELEHRSGLSEALELLTSVDVDGSEELAGLRREADALRRSVRPGGSGGSSRSSKLRSTDSDSNCSVATSSFVR